MSLPVPSPNRGDRRARPRLAPVAPPGLEKASFDVSPGPGAHAPGYELSLLRSLRDCPAHPGPRRAQYERKSLYSTRVIPSGLTGTASFSRPDVDVRSCTLCFKSRASTCHWRNSKGFARPLNKSFGEDRCFFPLLSEPPLPCRGNSVAMWASESSRGPMVWAAWRESSAGPRAAWPSTAICCLAGAPSAYEARRRARRKAWA